MPSRLWRAHVKKIEASYESPFQAHATMEPMNTTVHVRDDEIEVWSPTQFADEVQDGDRRSFPAFPPDKVTVHMTLSGGSFGRRYQWDYAAEAWQVAKEMKKPVQLLWTREDDMQHDFYRPYNYQRLSGGFDDQGEARWPGPPASSLPPSRGLTFTRGFTESPETLRDPATSGGAGMVRRRHRSLLDPKLPSGLCSRGFRRAALVVAVGVVVLHAVCQGMLRR